MKKIILVVLTFVFLISCDRSEELILAPDDLKSNVEKTKGKIDICHYDQDSGEYISINVSINALRAHLAHGDIIGNCSDNLVCHWEDPVNNIWKPLLVADEDLQEHLDHGDFLGSCGTNPGEDFTYIPDENFELALINLEIDSDGVVNKRVYTSDIEDLIILNVSGKNIKDLTGIEDFKNLRVLNFSNNEVTSVDLSNNNLLTLLRINNNQITNLDLSNNTLLRELYCYDNALVSLDLQNNGLLFNVYCWNNNLQSLNIKNGNNSGVNRCWAFSNPQLSFITVDDPLSANSGLFPYTSDKWRKDSATSFN